MDCFFAQASADIFQQAMRAAAKEAEDLKRTLWIASIAYWIICVALATMVGHWKGDWAAGMFMALIGGPLGVIAALAIDGRSFCPVCTGRLDGTGAVCQHCRAPLAWRGGIPYQPPLEMDELANPPPIAGASRRSSPQAPNPEARTPPKLR